MVCGAPIHAWAEVLRHLEKQHARNTSCPMCSDSAVVVRDSEENYGEDSKGQFGADGEPGAFGWRAPSRLCHSWRRTNTPLAATPCRAATAAARAGRLEALASNAKR